MCGISGYIGSKKLSNKIISQTLNVMKNRGPDHQGYTRMRFGTNFIYLLSSRLRLLIEMIDLISQ